MCMRLLDKDKKTRLGSNGDADEIMKHPFFASLNMDALMNETMEPPLKVDFSAD